MPKDPVDPLTSPPIAVRGRIVTMDDAGTVFDDGVLSARDGSIVDVRPVGTPPPDGFADVPVAATKGTVFPGLVELHNHLPYDVLGLWQVPKQYANRDQWSGPSNPDYRRLITGPMARLGADPTVTAAIVRFVEVRCLLGGTTTSQGITLAKSSGIVTHFRGLVRNVESPGDPDLQPAKTHIADVVATDGEKFLERISGKDKMILHLAEGTNAAARNHFAALQIAPGKWAITPNLIGIHCVALTDADFAVFGAHGGSMVWSPLSNLLLYGKTADIAAALRHKVPIALGSDWSPSGSKNLLGELKVARLAAGDLGVDLTARDLVAMATSTPARMLGWDAHLGTLQKDRRADLIVVHGAKGDPYSALVDADESAIDLVVINGIPRAGRPGLMKTTLGGTAGTEAVDVGGAPRVINLAQATADPDVAQLSIAQAQDVLEKAMHALPDDAAVHAFAPPPDGVLRLAVEGLVDNHMFSRHHLPYRGRATGPDYTRTVSALAQLRDAVAIPLPALTLDPLTATDNPAFYDAIEEEPNLPADVRDGIHSYSHPGH
jgi:cytosine/adenosine deaminase-related metal-dependent hydrolase